MKKTNDERFAALRDYLSKWAMTKLRRCSATEVEDLVHDTIERILRSETANTIEMTERELRGFAYTIMDRLLKNRIRDTNRRKKSVSSFIDICTTYDPGQAGEVEVDDVLARLGPRDTMIMFMVAEAGENATRVIRKTPGVSWRDPARIRKKLKRQLA